MKDSRPRKRVRVDHFDSFNIIGYTTRLENLLLALPFALIWSLIYMGIVGLDTVGGFFVFARSAIALFLSVTIFCCYLLVVIDYTARGFAYPTKISGALLSDNKARFIKVAIVTSFLVSLISTIGGDQWLPIFVAVTALTLPIILAVIAIQDSLIAAINPLTWIRFCIAVRLDRHTVFYLI